MSQCKYGLGSGTSKSMLDKANSTIKLIVLFIGHAIDHTYVQHRYVLGMLVHHSSLLSHP